MTATALAGDAALTWDKTAKKLTALKGTALATGTASNTDTAGVLTGQRRNGQLCLRWDLYATAPVVIVQDDTTPAGIPDEDR